MMIPELFSRRGQRFLKKSLCGLESWFTDCGVNLVLNSRTKKVMNVMKKMMSSILQCGIKPCLPQPGGDRSLDGFKMAIYNVTFLPLAMSLFLGEQT